MKAPRSGKISSLSQCFLKHSQRAEARVEKSEGSSEGKSLSPLVGFGARGRVITVIEKPKLSRHSFSVQLSRRPLHRHYAKKKPRRSGLFHKDIKDAIS